MTRESRDKAASVRLIVQIPPTLRQIAGCAKCHRRNARSVLGVMAENRVRTSRRSGQGDDISGCIPQPRLAKKSRPHPEPRNRTCKTNLMPLVLPSHRRPELDANPRTLSRAESHPQHRRDRDHARAVHGAVGPGLGRLLLWILVGVAAAGGAGRRLHGAGVHDPARLRSRRLLPPPARQRLGRPRDRRADAHALRLLAPHPRHSSRQLRPSRAARHGRHRHPDGARISGAVAMGTAALSASTGIRW